MEVFFGNKVASAELGVNVRLRGITLNRLRSLYGINTSAGIDALLSVLDSWAAITACSPTRAMPS
ncbi:hypothetical protein BURK2_01679 [Burkholderiales bacterium]|nr:MAG: hypothetical protein F9K47_07020 [Burkholderiales bacterium]CAG0978066.1 hypothetical protein BURK2_01679 [Burkholderiales bacterium]